MDKWPDFQANIWIDVNYVGVVFQIYHIFSRFVLLDNHNIILSMGCCWCRSIAVMVDDNMTSYENITKTIIML